MGRGSNMDDVIFSTHENFVTHKKIYQMEVTEEFIIKNKSHWKLKIMWLMLTSLWRYK